MKKIYFLAVCLILPFILFGQKTNNEHKFSSAVKQKLTGHNQNRSLSFTGYVTNIGCPGTTTGSISLITSGGDSPFSFLWSDGSTNQNLTDLTVPGDYCVSVTDTTGIMDTACWNVTSVEHAMVLISANADSTCLGDTISLSATSGFSNFHWSTGDSVQSVYAMSTGTYSVTATNTCGFSSSDEHYVHFFQMSPPTLQTYPVTYVCPGDPVLLSVNPVFGSYFWSTSETTSQIYAYVPGSYTVTVTSGLNCPYYSPAPVVITHGPYGISLSDSGQFCLNHPVQLSASCVFNNSNVYHVEQVPFDTEPNGGTNTGINVDDEVNGPYPIGFNFGFYNSAYSEFYIGSNGWIGFSGAPGNNSTGYDPWPTTVIPNIESGTPKNCIMACWRDWYPTIGPTPGYYIFYNTTGTTPNRELIVSYNAIPLFSCTTTYGTFQLVLYESSNKIRINLVNVPFCIGWNSGHGTEGIQNIDGTIACVVNGRNNTVWQATNESWLLTPINESVTWFANGPDSVYTGSGQQVTVPPYGTYYMQISSDNQIEAIDSITIINLAIPLDFSVTKINCHGQNDGSINLNPLYPDSLVFNWSNGATTSSLSNLPPGEYDVTITHHDCVYSIPFNITEPTVLTNQVNVTNIQENGYGSAEVIATGGVPPYSYHWSMGANTAQVTYLTQGLYFVTVTDSNGCQITGSAMITLGNEGLSGLSGIVLFQNTPNPFNSETEIRFYLPVTTWAEMEVRNLMGELVCKVFSQEFDRGLHSVFLDASMFPAGTYFVCIEAENIRKTIMVESK